jgi:FlaG/FlaF family flagellin (archaellin)
MSHTKAVTRPLRKVAAVAFAVVGISGLAMTGSAQASSPSVQLKVCNNSGDSAANITIAGYNQNGAYVTSPDVYVPADSACTTLAHWWWSTGQTVTVTWSLSYARDTTYCGLASTLKNGSTTEIWPVDGC